MPGKPITRIERTVGVVHYEPRPKPKTIVNIVLKSGKEFEVVVDGEPDYVYPTIYSMVENGIQGWLALPKIDGGPHVQILKSEIAAMSFYEVET